MITYWIYDETYNQLREELLEISQLLQTNLIYVYCPFILTKVVLHNPIENRGKFYPHFASGSWLFIPVLGFKTMEGYIKCNFISSYFF